MDLALGFTFACVLLAPVSSKTVEQNLEVFFLLAGVTAAAIGGQLGWPLLHEALRAPIALTAAVLVFGTVARVARPTLDSWFQSLLATVPARLVYFILIVGLGLLSSIITAVIAALFLVEAVALMNLDRDSETVTVVLACMAIGLGAALTPVGEPLGTIAIAALGQDFWYLMRLLGPLVVAGILIVAVIALLMPVTQGTSLKAQRDDPGWGEIAMRAAKVYLFVAGLVGLSWGFRPLVNEYLTRMPVGLLFWFNSVSAVVDNATLTAAEIGPSLAVTQQRAILMGLLISGGMLIPGNIPNIIAAGRLGIGSREWARVGLITGLPLMLLCFLVLQWLR
jgi:predicted cation transporter